MPATRMSLLPTLHHPGVPTVTLTGFDVMPFATEYRLLGPLSMPQGTVNVAVLTTIGSTERVEPIVLA
jgi:hypothetical protein